jgi:murein DD-endopeptidase MepM/ murein hydrolase activator NlpD
VKYAKYSNELVWDYKLDTFNPGQTKRKNSQANIKTWTTKRLKQPLEQGNRGHGTKTRQPVVKSSLYPVLLFSILFVLLFFIAVAISQAGPLGRDSLDASSMLTLDENQAVLEQYLFENHKGYDLSETQSLAVDGTGQSLTLQKYRVRKNDTYGKIANRFGITSETIYLVNNIQKKGILRAGALLTIPNMNGRIVKVNRNDSILKLASRYAVSWETIVDVNNLSSEVIHPGQELFIPGSQMTSYERNQFYSRLYVWPVKGRITSRFGPRIDPFTGLYSFHGGIDIGRSRNASVGSIKDGTVAFVGWSKIYGNYVIIKHSNRVSSTYAHLKSTSVKRGQVVSQGQKIGIVGNTGRSTGDHLHLEIRKNGKLVDPITYLP